MKFEVKKIRQLSAFQMKNIKGGNAPVDCMTSITCGNGQTYTCSGNNGTLGGMTGGSSMGCHGSDNQYAMCFYNEGNGWEYALIECHGSGNATTTWGSLA